MKKKDLFNLKGKTILLTGATGFLGKYIANNLLRFGCDLIVTDKYQINLKKIFYKKSKRIQYKNCDLESNNEIKLLCKWIKRNNKKIDVIINNAAFVGTSNLKGWNEKFENQLIDNWGKVFQVNLSSSFLIAQQLSGLMKKAKDANIINISSIYGEIPPKLEIYKNTNINNPAAYSASKAALSNLTKWLAVNLSPKIRVNSISPGGVYTKQNKIFVKKYINQTLLNRMTKPEDIFSCILFLSSSMSQYITGQNIVVDGGFTIK